MPDIDTFTSDAVLPLPMPIHYDAVSSYLYVAAELLLAPTNSETAAQDFNDSVADDIEAAMRTVSEGVFGERFCALTGRIIEYHVRAFETEGLPPQLRLGIRCPLGISPDELFKLVHAAIDREALPMRSIFYDHSLSAGYDKQFFVPDWRGYI